MATNKELLICIDVKLKLLKEQFDNHLKHHFLVTLASISATLTVVGALIVFIITK